MWFSQHLQIVLNAKAKLVETIKHELDCVTNDFLALALLLFKHKVLVRVIVYVFYNI